MVNRPNLFIKIPATDAGIPAIEQLLGEGVPVNITLLFSIQSYQAVIEAYFSALERRATIDRPLRPVVSVASFFVSRVDTLVDRLLAQRIPSGNRDSESLPAKLLGRAAVANAKLAYRTFMQSFTSERWKRLLAKGARVQRPLWASTGTKNSAYSDLCYVEPLVGRDTVNTMPEKTWLAFADHGRIAENAITADLDEASQVIQDLEKVGINLDCVLWQLEHEGVQQFVESFDAALATLEMKRTQLERSPQEAGAR
jgi:transaldolase